MNQATVNWCVSVIGQSKTPDLDLVPKVYKAWNHLYFLSLVETIQITPEFIYELVNILSTKGNMEFIPKEYINNILAEYNPVLNPKEFFDKISKAKLYVYYVDPKILTSLLHNINSLLELKLINF